MPPRNAPELPAHDPAAAAASLQQYVAAAAQRESSTPLCCNANCARPSRVSTLLRCGACKHSAYCSKECQVESRRNGHRTSCSMLVAASRSAFARNKLLDEVQARLATAVQARDAAYEMVPPDLSALGRMQGALLADADIMLAMQQRTQLHSGHVYRLLARMHQANSNMSESDRFFTMAKNMAARLEGTPGNSDVVYMAYRRYAESCALLGRTREAVDVYGKCLVLAADQPRKQYCIYGRLAHCHLELGEFTTSLAMFKCSNTPVQEQGRVLTVVDFVIKG